MKFSDERLEPGSRIALRVEYDGRAFNGWQAQKKHDVPTVQETLEGALSNIASESVRTWCAGRTDTGVHASGQIDPVGRSLKSWVLGVNSELPESVAVHWAGLVSSDFHARFSAVSRSYQYIIANAATRPAQLAGLVTWYRRPLSAEAMHECAQFLIGEHDFSAFRAASCQSSTPWRYLSKIKVTRQSDFVIVDLEANAFLHHMVRNIVGSLLLVGAGLKTQAWFEQVFKGRDRTKSGDTASSAGLYLVSVGYPDDCGIPFGPAAVTLLSHSI